MISDERLTEVWRQGREAYRQDRSRDTNPHGGPEFFAWDCGWLHQQDEDQHHPALCDDTDAD